MKTKPPWRRGAPLAAALAVAATFVTAACGPAEGPGPSASTSVPEVPATTIPGTPSRPAPLVAVDADGAVAAVDGGTGAVTRTLAPAPADGVAGGVTLSADKATAYFDRLASGGTPTIYSVPVDGSAPPTVLAQGGSPDAHPTGTKLAYLTATQVIVLDTATGTQQAWSSGGAGSLLTWASSGTRLMWVRDQNQLMILNPAAFAQPQVVSAGAAEPGEKVYATLGGSGYVFGSAIVGSGPADTSVARLTLYTDHTVDRLPTEENAGYRDRAVDASGHWLLRVDALGNLRWSVGGGTGLIATGFRFADW